MILKALNLSHLPADHSRIQNLKVESFSLHLLVFDETKSNQNEMNFVSHNSMLTSSFDLIRHSRFADRRAKPHLVLEKLLKVDDYGFHYDFKFDPSKLLSSTTKFTQLGADNLVTAFSPGAAELELTLMKKSLDIKMLMSKTYFSSVRL
jgi:hypothetical protein